MKNNNIISIQTKDSLLSIIHNHDLFMESFEVLGVKLENKDTMMLFKDIIANEPELFKKIVKKADEKGVENSLKFIFLFKPMLNEDLFSSLLAERKESCKGENLFQLFCTYSNYSNLSNQEKVSVFNRLLEINPKEMNANQYFIILHMDTALNNPKLFHKIWAAGEEQINEKLKQQKLLSIYKNSDHLINSEGEDSKISKHSISKSYSLVYTIGYLMNNIELYKGVLTLVHNYIHTELLCKLFTVLASDKPENFASIFSATQEVFTAAHYNILLNDEQIKCKEELYSMVKTASNQNSKDVGHSL